jgi:hypothetical protein
MKVNAVNVTASAKMRFLIFIVLSFYFIYVCI